MRALKKGKTVENKMENQLHIKKIGTVGT